MPRARYPEIVTRFNVYVLGILAEQRGGCSKIA
jgi:hypothetical protein